MRSGHSPSEIVPGYKCLGLMTTGSGYLLGMIGNPQQSRGTVDMAVVGGQAATGVLRGGSNGLMVASHGTPQGCGGMTVARI